MSSCCIQTHTLYMLGSRWKMTVSISFGMPGSFHELKERIIDRCACSTRAILWTSTIYEQSILPVDDTLAEDLIVSCYTDANNSVADECQMNSDLKKWKFMSEGRDNFAMLKDWLFILIFPGGFYLMQHTPLLRSKFRILSINCILLS